MKAVLGLAEIVLWTHDLPRCRAFYGDLFGLEPISPPGSPRLFLSAGVGPGGIPQMIVLMPHPVIGGVFPAPKPQRVLHHLAFAVDALAYDDLEKRCAGSGLQVRQGVHPVLTGVRTFYVDDPEGNEVEVIALERPEPAPEAEPPGPEAEPPGPGPQPKAEAEPTPGAQPKAEAEPTPGAQPKAEAEPTPGAQPATRTEPEAPGGGGDPASRPAGGERPASPPAGGPPAGGPARTDGHSTLQGPFPRQAG